MTRKLLLLVCGGLLLGLAAPSLAEIKVAESLLVDLRADDLTEGTVTTPWTNYGTLSDFNPMGGPVAGDVDGRKAVTFDATNFFEGPSSVPTIEGGDSRSIEVWVYNDTATVDEETMVSWSHRGGPDATNMSFNYGQHNAWGAVGHWGGAADMPWSAPHAPLPAVENWWHLVYTYDGDTVRLYVNGEENTTRALALNTHAGNTIRVAAQADDSGNGAQAGLGFTGSIAEVRIHAGALTAEDVAHNFVSNRTDGAGGPSPDDAETDVPRPVTLQWSAGPYAVNRDVYFGESEQEVAAATNASPEFKGSQTETTYVIEPPLNLGQTYYWRVDEVNDLHAESPWPGSVWNFTVEAVAYPMPSSAVIATASSSSLGTDPQNTANGLGLNENDQHSTNADHMWLNAADDPDATVTYSFDRAYKLDEMRVWNSNQSTETLLGLGVKDVTIATSLDGTTWSDLATLEFAQASGLPTEEGSLVNLDQVVAQSIRLSIHSNWGGLIPQYALSEVRFYYIPTFARELQPENGTANLDPIVPLSWRSGREAAQHDIYLGTDPNNLPLLETVTETSLDASVNLGTQYYWQVAEVNDAEDPSVWPGATLSFSTRDFVLIDDMESYRDADGFWIWQRWNDGFGDPDNGAVVGHGDLPETEIVFEGDKSMPLSYDGASWTTQALGWTDWTAGGVQSLRLFFSGSPDNTGSGLYVEVNGQRVTYPDDAHIMSSQWRQWDVPLADLGDLSSAESLTVGITSGNGMLYIDAMGLYPEIAVPATPTDPGTNGLGAKYSMEGDLTDDSGNGLDGTVEGGALFSPGLPDMGQAMTFDGLIDFGTLPIGPVIAAADSMTIALWADFSNEGGAWQRLFDFGDDTNNYIMLTPREGTAGPMIFAIKNPIVATGNTEQRLYGPTTMSPGWRHIAMVIDSSDMSMTLYVDGIDVASDTILALPSDLGETAMNYLGKSQWPDALYQGAMDEVLIYTRALSSGEISYLAGAR